MSLPQYQKVMRNLNNKTNNEEQNKYVVYDRLMLTFQTILSISVILNIIQVSTPLTSIISIILIMGSLIYFNLNTINVWIKHIEEEEEE